MVNLQGRLDERIKKLGEGFGTDDPLLAESVILISRTLADIGEKMVGDDGNFYVRVRIDDVHSMTVYGIESQLKGVETQINKLHPTMYALNSSIAHLIHLLERYFRIFISFGVAFLITFAIIAAIVLILK